jgi:hypothetical protein
VNLPYIAYLSALLLWIPLGILAAVSPASRRRVMVPLVMSVIGAIYEVVMRNIAPLAIRLDILLAMGILSVVDAISGFGLIATARGRPDRNALLFAGVLCLAVPALELAGSASFKSHTANLDRNFALGQRFLFEASFRDDATQKRVFGDLKAAKNPWAGHYLNATTDDDRFGHVIINDEGRFWVYHPKLYYWMGNGAPNAAGDAFEGAGEGHMHVRSRIQLRRHEGGSFLLNVDFGTTPAPATPIAVRLNKVDPPRFPPPAKSPRDEVRFLGVFSGIYGERNDSFWLSQVWLWESGGEVWGRYLRDHYRRGYARDFISTGKITASCSQECKELSFETGRGRITITRTSEDEFTVTQGSDDKGATLKRGETMPGFLYDLAPLATKKENQEWLEAVSTASSMISWRVPSAPDTSPTSAPSSRDPNPPR